MILSEGNRRARNQYRCEGFDQVDRFGWKEAISAGAELPKMPHAIHVGEKYFYQTARHDGDGIQTFKSCLHCWEVIKSQKLFEEY